MLTFLAWHADHKSNKAESRGNKKHGKAIGWPDTCDEEEKDDPNHRRQESESLLTPWDIPPQEGTDHMRNGQRQRLYNKAGKQDVKTNNDLRANTDHRKR